jgi:hypothetical protein
MPEKPTVGRALGRRTLVQVRGRTVPAFAPDGKSAQGGGNGSGRRFCLRRQ